MPDFFRSGWLRVKEGRLLRSLPSSDHTYVVTVSGCEVYSVRVAQLIPLSRPPCHMPDEWVGLSAGAALPTHSAMYPCMGTEEPV